MRGGGVIKGTMDAHNEVFTRSGAGENSSLEHRLAFDNTLEQISSVTFRQSAQGGAGEGEREMSYGKGKISL